MRKVVIVAPEFVPQNTAAVNRSRFFASCLPKFDWEPTILTMKKEAIEGPVDERFEKLLPEGLKIVRTGALPVKPVRLIGDTGLRVLSAHRKALDEMCRQGEVDALFIPGPPWFTYLLGPHCLKKFGVPYVIDYIDPWVSSVSAAAHFPQKAWFYHRLALHYEKKVLEKAGFVTAVSQGIGDELLRRYDFLKKDRFAAMPYGCYVEDFKKLENLGVEPPDFRKNDGNFNVCFTGALQPLGGEILEAFFRATLLVRDRRPDIYKKLKLRFYGTSNLTWGRDCYKVMPMAKRFLLEAVTSETPERISYLQSLAVQKSASLNLVTGSSAKYYHASKLYSCLLARNPLLAICHAESSIASALHDLGVDNIVTFAKESEIAQTPEKIFEKISQSFDSPRPLPQWAPDALHAYSAEGVTEKLAGILDRVHRESKGKLS